MTAPHRLDTLTVEECLQLLAGNDFGRIGYVDGGAPRILPLNYQFFEGSVVFRTAFGALLDVVHHAAVVFEVDEVEPRTRTGWSVVVRGRAEEVWQPEELERLRALPLRPWAPGQRDHYLRILSSEITGRRVR